MRRTLRVFLLSLMAVVAIGAVLIGVFVYTPEPEKPLLSGTLAHGRIVVDGLSRTYLLYLPKGLQKGAPLVVAMHGSGESGAQMRIGTGYGFDREADRHAFAVVYPNGVEGYWNACNIVGDYSANTRNIDDVGFLDALVDKLVAAIGVDPARVFAIGVSRGGHMAIRLALEAPSHFRAVAVVAANVPTAENFKCKPAGHGTSSVLIMNGTKDPLNPFNGGDAKLLGLFMDRGNVMSSRDSGQYFANLNAIAGAPVAHETAVADGFAVEQLHWHGRSRVEIELDAIVGGGHVLPQPYRRAPRLLGPTPTEPNGPQVIWAFFARQRPLQL